MFFPVSGWFAAFVLTLVIELPIAAWLLRRVEPDLARRVVLIGYANDVAELYDPAANAWVALPPMPDGRSGGAVAVIADGSVVLVGGLADLGSEEQTLLTTAVRLVP